MLPVVENYTKRDQHLQELGFKNYTEYLQSELWAGIRVRVFADYGEMCYVCLRKATCVHHCSYSLDVMLGTDITYLVPLCGWCHKNVEFNRRGRRGIRYAYGYLVGKMWQHHYRTGHSLHPILIQLKGGAEQAYEEGTGDNKWWHTTGKFLYGGEKREE